MDRWEEAKARLIPYLDNLFKSEDDEEAGWLAYNMELAFKAADAEITRLKEELGGARELIAWACAGTTLYADDGELQDNSQKPFIDFRRDTIEEIKHKIQVRGNTAYAAYLNDSKQR